MRAQQFLLVAAFTAMTVLSRPAGATEPLDSPRPQDFVRVEILEPRHGLVQSADHTTVRVRVTPLGGYSGRLNLRVTVMRLGQDDSRRMMDRQGNPVREPFYLRDGESVVEIPVQLTGTGIHSIEAETGSFQPFSNRAEVKIGVNPYLPR